MLEPRFARRLFRGMQHAGLTIMRERCCGYYSIDPVAALFRANRFRGRKVDDQRDEKRGEEKRSRRIERRPTETDTRRSIGAHNTGTAHSERKVRARVYRSERSRAYNDIIH